VASGLHVSLSLALLARECLWEAGVDVVCLRTCSVLAVLPLLPNRSPPLSIPVPIIMTHCVALYVVLCSHEKVGDPYRVKLLFCRSQSQCACVVVCRVGCVWGGEVSCRSVFKYCCERRIMTCGRRRVSRPAAVSTKDKLHS
jgi:hypothetical protein